MLQQILHQTTEQKKVRPRHCLCRCHLVAALSNNIACSVLSNPLARHLQNTDAVKQTPKHRARHGMVRKASVSPERVHQPTSKRARGGAGVLAARSAGPFCLGHFVAHIFDPERAARLHVKVRRQGEMILAPW